MDVQVRRSDHYIIWVPGTGIVTFRRGVICALRPPVLVAYPMQVCVKIVRHSLLEENLPTQPAAEICPTTVSGSRVTQIWELLTQLPPAVGVSSRRTYSRHMCPRRTCSRCTCSGRERRQVLELNKWDTRIAVALKRVGDPIKHIDNSCPQNSGQE